MKNKFCKVKRWLDRDFRSDLQSSEFVAVVTQGVALGWDMAAPLALSESRSRFPAGMETRRARAKARLWLKGSSGVRGVGDMAGPSTA